MINISKNNIIDLLKYRGFDISTDVIERFMQNDSKSISVQNNKEIHKFIYNFNDKLNKNTLNKIINEYHEITDKKQVFTIITFENITKTIENTINILSEKYKSKIVLFDIKNLMINPTKHHLFAKHELINANDDFKKALCEELHIDNIYKIPKISVNDVMAKYINLNIGDICKITRKTNQGQVAIFKLCV